MDSNKRIWVLLGVSAVALGVPYLIKQPADKHAGDKPPAAAVAKDGSPVAATAPAAPAGGPARKLSPSELAARAAGQQLGTLETDSYVARVSNLNGGLTSFQLKGKHFAAAGKQLDLVSTDKEAYLPLAVDI